MGAMVVTHFEQKYIYKAMFPGTDRGREAGLANGLEIKCTGSRDCLGSQLGKGV